VKGGARAAKRGHIGCNCEGRMMKRFVRRTPLLVLSALAFACGATDDADPEPLPSLGARATDPTHASTDAGATDASRARGDDRTGAFDEAALLATVANAAYRTSRAFVHVTHAPFASRAAAGASVELYVSAFAGADYARISPDASGSHASLPRGALLVREVQDGAGTVAKLTLMAKGPAGFNPALGDWWFGVTTPVGVPLVTDGGRQTGPLPACFACHDERGDDDYLFGVAPSARAPGGP
jgi:hypothetical protein